MCRWGQMVCLACRGPKRSKIRRLQIKRTSTRMDQGWSLLRAPRQCPAEKHQAAVGEDALPGSVNWPLPLATPVLCNECMHRVAAEAEEEATSGPAAQASSLPAWSSYGHTGSLTCKRQRLQHTQPMRLPYKGTIIRMLVGVVPATLESQGHVLNTNAQLLPAFT